MTPIRRTEHFLTKWLSCMSIRRKLLICCVVGLLVSALSISGVLIYLNYQSAYDTTLRLSYASLDQISANVVDQINAQHNTVNSLKSYKSLSIYLKQNYDTQYDNYLYFMERVYPGLKLISDSSGEMRLRIYSQRGVTSFFQITGGFFDELMRADWYDPSATQRYGAAWGLTRMYAGGKWQQALCCYASIWGDDHNVEYVISVYLSEDTLRKQFPASGEGIALLLNGEGIVVSSNMPEFEGEHADGLAAAGELSLNAAPADNVYAFRGDSYLLMRRELKLDDLGLNGWQMVYLAPYAQVIRDVENMVYRSVAITLLILSVFMLIALTVANHMSRRLGILVGKIGAVSRGDFQTGKLVTGTDEIARINQCFDDMVDQIRTLIDDNEEIHRRLIDKTRTEQEIVIRQRDAELSALRAQINPHYLFNTLETIRMNLLISGDRDTAQVMLLFAESIREYMTPAGTWMVLEDELGFIDKYIFIQQYRFGRRIHFSRDVPESLNACMIPRLMLQPLIENAIHHGIECKHGGGSVTLRAWRDRGTLVFSVEDDGVGMDAEQLKALIRHIHADKDEKAGYTQLGLRNVQQRIRLLYGSEYGLWIESTPGEGTKIQLILPDAEV